MEPYEYDEHGVREREDGGYDVDPTHPENLADKRWDYARQIWALSHGYAGASTTEDA